MKGEASTCWKEIENGMMVGNAGVRGGLGGGEEGRICIGCGVEE